MTRVNLKISVSGVRGTVGDSLTPSLVCGFAAAFGEYVGGGRVIIGRDTRNSGPMFEQAVVAGLLAVGCQPVLVGVVPTPTVQIMVNEYNANGGFAITASHNPAEWNALKLIGASGIFLNQAEASELLMIYNQPDRNYVPEEDYRNVRQVANAFDIHRQRIDAQIDKDPIRQAHIRVAIDCCNGAGALYAKSFLEDLGCDVFAIHEETDAGFQRKPEPLPENIQQLGKAVVDHQCAIGFALDPDGDRLVVVGADGQPIGEQYSVVLAVEHVLSRRPGPVVVNVQTTQAVRDVAERHHCPLYLTPVGDVNVTKKMLAEKAVIGGEGSSGGIIFPAVHPCRDSFTGMALLLEMLAVRGQSLQQVMEHIPHYTSRNVKIPCTAALAVELVRHLTNTHARARPITIDGLRLELDDAWVLVRGSNTEPVVRIFAEALDPERADELINEFVNQIQRL